MNSESQPRRLGSFVVGKKSGSTPKPLVSPRSRPVAKRPSSSPSSKSRPNKKQAKYESCAELLAQAKPFVNEHGLVIQPVPAELMDQLRKNRLAICGGDLLPPNVEGLTSRWWIPQSAAEEKQIRRALDVVSRKRKAEQAEQSSESTED
ncbi:MAG: hypothetical protein R3C28_16725 [Pirellulaceae bacterium]